MDIDLLKTFLEVNKTRHFGKASENLYLTQAAISARIKLLEENLGVTLFIRARNNIQLTREGERLVPHAEAMLLSWTHVREDVTRKKELPNKLRISTTPALSRHVLQNKTAQIARHFSNLTLCVDILPHAEIIRSLQDGSIDIGLLYEPLAATELSVQSIGKLKLMLMSSSADTSVKEAFNHYIYIDWGAAFDTFHSKRFSDTNAPALHTNISELAENHLRRHGGAAYLPANTLTQPSASSTHAANIYAVKNAPIFSKEVLAVYKSDFRHPSLLTKILTSLTL